MKKEILVRETAGVERAGEYLRVALPLGRGELQPGTPLAASLATDPPRPCQQRVLKQWPDGSVKWLLLDFAVDAAAGADLRCVVAPAPMGLQPAAGVEVVPGTDSWQVHTGAGTFVVDATTFRPFLRVTRGDGNLLDSVRSLCRFSTDGVVRRVPQLERVELEEPGPLHAVLRLSGSFSGGDPGQEVQFASRLHFFAASLAVRVEFTLHNPRPARHPGGLWDLGDPGSLLFRELAIDFGLTDTALPRLYPEPGSPALEADAGQQLLIYQESSGGANWRSPNHRNRKGEVPLTRQGFLVCSGEREIAGGLRAAPTLWCGAGAATGEGVSVAVPNFWQEFPKALRGGADLLSVEIFPGCFPDLHELQGGEQKTHAFVVDFAAAPGALAWVHSPLEACAASRHYRESGVLNDLPGERDLVDRFVTAQGLLAKREALDEYGWRNFGDLYADHEAVFHQGETTFVSHYNNQYDFVAGAYRKAFATGDSHWRELAADLARHVRDIDLYHTDGDREEYNRGLFWHTDHYLDAGLSTHRTCSREQLVGRQAEQCGGGPGAEHCYATGLMLHYFQTGDPDFKQAVIDLARWELVALEGPSALLAALRRSLGYLLLWRGSRGERRLFPRYPLTRGTGNAVTACLDAFEVGGGREFLERAAELIRGALHPGDDIEARKLLDAEVAWSYTVLLVAVVKFLEKKRELGEWDDDCRQAQAAFLAYARWMARHEYPFLDKPQSLEYPNETWAAQDLRKAVVFYWAARYADSAWRPDFLEQGRRFLLSSSEELPRWQTAGLARPVVLMLQNAWVQDRLELGEAGYPEQERAVVWSGGSPTPYLSLGVVLRRSCRLLANAFRHVSWRKEIAYLQSRL
jgi:hypothetical protein